MWNTLEPEDISKTGFVVKYTALTEHAIYGVFVSWFAFYDPMVTVQVVEKGELEMEPEATSLDPYH